MSRTRTGSFSIGFRRGWGDWQRDLPGWLDWVAQSGYQFVDVGPEAQVAKAVVDAGVTLGSVDLVGFKDLITEDATQRDAAIAANAELMRAVADLGGKLMFTCMLPHDPSADRAANYERMLLGYEPLVSLADDLGLHIVIEGYPGPGALCCTPETVRSIFARFDTPALGFNYDPSHLIRLGVDPLRFLREFVSRVYHTHAKDTEILSERQYELGTEQAAVFAGKIGFGGGHWRYTLPGHGVMRWTEAFGILAEAGYAGGVSVELEDANFNGTDAGEQSALLHSLDYLSAC